MTKIIKSLAVVAFVAAIAIGGTIAYLSDVEKSADNTFVAGAFDLKIDSECHFNGAECICLTTDPEECYWDKKDAGGDFNGQFGNGEVSDDNRCYCTWTAKDLTNEKFFDLANLIPGDSGEATISMHVSGDDYYVRSKVDNVKNNDNGCNKQECVAEGGTWNSATKLCPGVTCGDPGSDVSGELEVNMEFAFWADMGTTQYYQCPAGVPGCAADPEEGDNILNTEWEYASYLVTSAMPDPGDGWSYVKKNATEHYSFRDGATYYMGVAWCVGDLIVGSSFTNPNDFTGYVYGDITCDGSGVNNIIQSDSYSSDMTFEVVQATHNSSTDPFNGMP